MVNNDFYARFVEYFSERFKDDDEAISCMEQSLFTNGLSLDILFLNNKMLAEKMLKYLIVASKELSGERNEIKEHVIIFQKLYNMLSSISCP